MTSITTKPDSSQPAAEMAVDLFDTWFDPIETEVRARAHEFIEELIRGELDAVLARPRYGRSQMAGSEERAGVAGHRHGSRTRSLTGTFGPIEIAVPRARLNTPEGKTTEWKSKALRAYQRRTLAADALIASTYLAGTNTRRVRRALAALFGGTVGKDTVSRTWRKVKSDWDAWNTRSLAEEPIVRLILDGTVVRVRLDRKATSISLLVVLGVRADGQKVLLAIKSMGGESAEAWRTVLDDLIKRGLRRPEFLIVDGAPGLDKAIASVWDGVPVLLRRAACPGYGVEHSGGSQSDLLQVRAVGIGNPTDARDTSRDRDMETIWCGEFQRLQALVGKSGGNLSLESARPVGQYPLKVVPDLGGSRVADDVAATRHLFR